MNKNNVKNALAALLLVLGLGGSVSAGATVPYGAQREALLNAPGNEGEEAAFVEKYSQRWDAESKGELTVEKIDLFLSLLNKEKNSFESSKGPMSSDAEYVIQTQIVGRANEAKSRLEQESTWFGWAWKAYKYASRFTSSAMRATAPLRAKLWAKAGDKADELVDKTVDRVSEAVEQKVEEKVEEYAGFAEGKIVGESYPNVGVNFVVFNESGKQIYGFVSFGDETNQFSLEKGEHTIAEIPSGEAFKFMVGDKGYMFGTEAEQGGRPLTVYIAVEKSGIVPDRSKTGYTSKKVMVGSKQSFLNLKHNVNLNQLRAAHKLFIVQEKQEKAKQEQERLAQQQEEQQQEQAKQELLASAQEEAASIVEGIAGEAESSAKQAQQAQQVLRASAQEEAASIVEGLIGETEVSVQQQQQEQPTQAPPPPPMPKAEPVSTVSSTSAASRPPMPTNFLDELQAKRNLKKVQPKEGVSSTNLVYDEFRDRVEKKLANPDLPSVQGASEAEWAASE
jgi:hypothetical protein